MDFKARQKEESDLLQSIKAHMKTLEALLHGHEGSYEDYVYRFYHQSFKVYIMQELTRRIVVSLRSLAPHLEMNEWFLQIVNEGTGKVFVIEDNERWLKVTRPIVEAYFHARYFLEMACKYGKQLESPPQPMPSGWAAVLYLFNLR